jgi:Tol biopolymer transport system component
MPPHTENTRRYPPFVLTSIRVLGVSSPIWLILSCIFVRWYIVYGQYPVYDGPSGSTVIVYKNEVGPGSQLYAMLPDGTEHTRLTYHYPTGGLFGTPIGLPFNDLVHHNILGAGPDMQGIYYFSTFEYDSFHFYYLPLNGERFRRIPSMVKDHRRGNASVSPGGEFLVYSDRDGYLFLYNLTERTKRCIINCDEETPIFRYALPAWNLDNRRLVLSISDRAREESHIHIYDIVTEQLTRITNPSGEHHVGPAWSPDGTRIAFTIWKERRQGEGATSNIYVMNADSSNQQQLTTSGEDSSAAWSPDGTQLVFASQRLERLNEFEHFADDIYRMNADGSDQVLLTSGTGSVDYHSPIWVVIP